jgi:GNAT superfamily N-acetyltransferase
VGGSPRGAEAALRNAKPDDMTDILSFLENAAGVLPRPAEDFRRAVETGLFYLVEIEDAIAGVAGLFFLDEQGEGPLEMGGCYLAPAIRGFGLQKVLARTRIAAAIAFYDEDATVYTAVKPDNAPSLRSITSLGFEPMRHHEPLLEEPCHVCQDKPDTAGGRRCCSDFYSIGQLQKCEAIKDLLHSDPLVLRRKVDGVELHLSLAIQLLRVASYRAALQEFISSSQCASEAQ